MEFDAVLIEQSIAKQYGVLPSAQGDLTWAEWAKLVSGLMDDTPLGRVVAVRSESDREIIKHFSPWQRQVRAEWAARRARSMTQQDKESNRKAMQALEAAMAKLFGGR